MRDFARALAFLCLTMFYAVSPPLTAREPDEKATSFFFSAYLARPEEGVTFAASAPAVELQVKSALPMSLTRTLLLIIDPASYFVPQMRR